ncbi:SDR family NAD(P)-dependent oxidoreductase [Deinococcus sp.]|uniref:SDR family NAD(P)-dependent oxidoreductase n=1 Tax=Deinococcus sp. TaxID=47478 RepID=UPI003C7C7EB7
MRRLEGRRAIVTGAGSGIGRAIALRFAEEGARVLVADLNADAAEESRALLATPGLSRAVDVSRGNEVQALIQAALDAWGGLETLVNNAGIGVAATAPDTGEDDWDRVLNVNLKGTFFGLKYGIPAIRRTVQGQPYSGSVINMSSAVALVGVPNRAAYSASKGGVLALTRAAAIDHVSEGVRVNAILPGTVDTPWVQNITASQADPEGARAAMTARQPHGRLVTAQEIAAMAAYLASDESASVIGAGLVVDGGFTAR